MMTTFFLALALAQPQTTLPQPDQYPVPPPIVIRAGRHVRTLPRDATAKQILFARVAVQMLDRLDRGRLVRPLARPFDRLRARLDARLLDRVSILAEMTPYTRAKNTQAISRLGGFDRRFAHIEVVPRTRLARKWQVPGGLEHSFGWTSQLYKYEPSEPWAYKTLMPVTNSGGYIQHEEGWTRSYPSGTVFADVLSTSAGPFEVRLAEKRYGRWEHYVAWSDVSAAPVGYRRPARRECRNCHSEAGSGAYGVGLVPGGDSVISDPFGALQ